MRLNRNLSASATAPAAEEASPLPPGLERYRPHLLIHLIGHPYSIRTASTPAEVLEALKLRHSVFLDELLRKSDPSGIDTDEFDLVSDHLLIRDERSGKTVGTYRLISSCFSEKFYSQTEFVIDQVLTLEGNKLEMGRACIAKEHRTGPVIQLLWRGIVEYVRRTGTEYLFGCSSVMTPSQNAISRIREDLQERKLVSYDLGVSPRKNYDLALECSEQDAEAPVLPPLLTSYLRAGARILGDPAWDPDFRCFDFFTCLRVSEMNASFRRRFGLC